MRGAVRLACLLPAVAIGPLLAAPERVPFETERNKILITASIDGSRPLRLMLDTGMVHGVLLRHPAIAEEIGLVATRKIVVDGAGSGAPVEADVATAAEVRVGGLTLHRQPVFVMPADSDYARMSAGSRADGVIGHSLFDHRVVEIDNDGGSVTFHPRDAPPATPENAATLRLSIEGRKPYIQAEVVLEDGRRLPVKLAVDTGASRCLYLNPEADRSIRPPRAHIETTLGRGVLGRSRGRIGRIPGLRLGPWMLPEVVTGFPDVRMRGLARDRHGILGNELLSRFDVVFDYPRRQMTLVPNSRFDDPMEHDMAGVELDPGSRVDGAIPIEEVLADSPAGRAGIRAGDLLLAVNGRPVDTMSVSELQALFRAAAGREYDLDLLRGADRLSVRIRLERLI